MLSILLHLLQTCLVLPDCQPRSSQYCSFMLVLNRRRCAARLHSPSHTYVFNHVQTQCIHVCPHTFTLMTRTPMRVFTYKSPQAACIWVPTKCSGIHRCAYIVTYRNTLSHLPLRHNHVNVKVCACLKMPSLKGLHSSPIHSPPKHSHIPQHRYHMQIPYPLDILRHKLIFTYLYTRGMHTTCIFEHTCKRTQIHCKPTEKYFQVTFMYVCVKQPCWEMNCWQFCRGKSCSLLKIKFFASSQFIIVAETWSSFKLQIFVTIINIKDSSETSLKEQKILPYSLWPAYIQLQCHHCYLYCSSTRSQARDQEPTVLGAVQSDPDFKEFIANTWIPPYPVQHNSRFQW